MKKKIPRAAEVARQDFYVDDLRSGANTTLEAEQLIVDPNQQMASWKFELRKWASNFPDEIQHLPTQMMNIIF